MSADQQFINFGSSANDGTGDPLRTAFIKTDLNFDSIWNAGPVGSNVTILNNTIRTVNVNGNLVLQPDGIGQVLSAATVAPNRNLSYDLGSQTLRWRAIYAGSITANNITYNGNVFTGNLEGNVLYSDGETLLINNVSGEITANSVTAASAIFNSIRSDDSTFVVVQDGLTVEGTVQAREDIDVTGNVAASYFIGNGSLLSGVASNYGNANVAAFLVDYNGLMSAFELDTPSLVHEFPLTISTNGGGEWEFAGNILRGPQGGAWSEAANTIYFNSPANGFVNISSLQSGNVVSELFMEHSFIRFLVDNGVPAKTWQMDLSGEFSVPGDIIPQSNGTASLGNATNYWANLWVAGNLIVGNIESYGNISGSVAGFAIGYRDIPQVAFTGNATIAAADAGKHFYSTESTDYVLTIADNSTVSWPVGTAITVVNRGTGNITVAQASGVSLYLAGNSSAGNRSVSTYGMATVLNVAANVWMINGTGVS